LRLPPPLNALRASLPAAPRIGYRQACPVPSPVMSILITPSSGSAVTCACPRSDHTRADGRPVLRHQGRPALGRLAETTAVRGDPGSATAALPGLREARGQRPGADRIRPCPAASRSCSLSWTFWRDRTGFLRSSLTFRKSQRDRGIEHTSTADLPSTILTHLLTIKLNNDVPRTRDVAREP